ncbi:MAG TPA: type IX secretion system sortase PorU, partial [Bacteroidia bacterium]|nr:type IX secretion system sortase PorU [Bacteroidia bacterium]
MYNPDQHYLRWTAPITTQFTDQESRTFLWFDGASYDAERNFLPYFFQKQKISDGTSSATATLVDPVYEALDQASLSVMGFGAGYIGSQPEVKTTVSISRKETFANVTVLPFRRNPVTGAMERLVSFQLRISENGRRDARFGVTPQFANNSVLATGTWYKIGVVNTGVQKIDYNFLSNMGIDMSALDPRNIRIYGNGKGQLSFKNSVAHEDDLQEYSIVVQGEADGVFDTQDYILFYGISPNSWTFDSTDMHFHHHVHDYSDTTYYFLNTDLGPGKRVTQRSSSSLTPTDVVTSFDDYKFFESNNTNLIKSGREWYGEEFDIINQYSYQFNFPNIDPSSPACAEVDLVSRCDAQNYYTVTAQSTSATITISNTSSSCYYCPFANPGNAKLCFNPGGPSILVTVTRQANQYAVTGWMNWVRVNARRFLTMTNGQMFFRDSRSAGPGKVSQFVMGNYNASQTIWDVTDFANIYQQNGTVGGGNYTWVVPTDSLHEFVCFDGTQYETPVYHGPVANQNLHALQPADLIIISYPDFLPQALELAQFHATMQNFSYVIVTPQQIYNEFSSGEQDATALRDFVRMLYWRAGSPSQTPRFLLLFGDGSYDNKHRVAANSNFIPTFQNLNSVGLTESYTSDQFYTLMDSNEGEWDDSSDNGDCDIGVGRLPVRNTTEAEDMVNKVKHYMTMPQPVYNLSACSAAGQCSKGGEWRNCVTFIGDDEDNDIHMSQADQLATYVSTNYPTYNIDKIYLDAYQQEQTPGGERYPAVNAAFDQRVDKGCLILNYTGHGGEVGLAHERILEVSQINAWTNLCNMPLFVTATCEFSRFDDPARTSAGEYVLLNSNGGGIGLLTTVRLVYSTPNFNLNQKFYECAFNPVNGEMPC